MNHSAWSLNFCWVQLSCRHNWHRFFPSPNLLIEISAKFTLANWHWFSNLLTIKAQLDRKYRESKTLRWAFGNRKLFINISLWKLRERFSDCDVFSQMARDYLHVFNAWCCIIRSLSVAGRLALKISPTPKIHIKYFDLMSGKGLGVGWEGGACNRIDFIHQRVPAQLT